MTYLVAGSRAAYSWRRLLHRYGGRCAFLRCVGCWAFLVLAMAAGCRAAADSAPGSPPAALPRLRFSDADVYRLLLPRQLAGDGLASQWTSLTSNAALAALFADPETALHRLERTGRLTGAAAEYRRSGAVAGAPAPLAVTTTAAIYGDEAKAAAALADPDLRLLLLAFDFTAREIGMAVVGDESRAFQALPRGGDTGTVSYVIVFRRKNVLQSLTVVMAREHDDDGVLLRSLALKQVLTTPLYQEITAPF